MYECETHKRKRLEYPKGISKHQQQAVTSKGTIRAKIISNDFGFSGELLIDSNSIFVVANFF